MGMAWKSFKSTYSRLRSVMPACPASQLSYLTAFMAALSRRVRRSPFTCGRI